MDDQDRPSWTPLRPQLSREKLDEYLKVLSKRYCFVSLTDAVEMLRGHKPMEPYSVVLTFDDGYRNNMTHALPILRRHNAPATFFVPTGFLDNPRPFWCDRLDYALQHADVHGREVTIGTCTVHLDASSREALCESYKRMRRSAKEQDMSDHAFLRDIANLAGQLEKESGTSLDEIHHDDDWSVTMTWDHIRQIVGDDVTIGSHTVDHMRLGLVDTEHARDQLIRSKRDVEAQTGRPCQTLCYPNGSYGRETVELARQCGYLCAVTTEEGLNRPGDDLMTLKRINVPTNTPPGDLVAQMCSASACLSWTKHRLVSLLKMVTRRDGTVAVTMGDAYE